MLCQLSLSPLKLRALGFEYVLGHRVAIINFASNEIHEMNFILHTNKAFGLKTSSIIDSEAAPCPKHLNHTFVDNNTWIYCLPLFQLVGNG